MPGSMERLGARQGAGGNHKKGNTVNCHFQTYATNAGGRRLSVCAHPDPRYHQRHRLG